MFSCFAFQKALEFLLLHLYGVKLLINIAFYFDINSFGKYDPDKCVHVLCQRFYAFIKMKSKADVRELFSLEKTMLILVVYIGL